MFFVVVKGKRYPLRVEVDAAARRYTVTATGPGFAFSGTGANFEAALNQFLNAAQTAFTSFGGL